MGINAQQDDYYESLFRRTTASYRAKIDKENNKNGHVKMKGTETEASRRKQPKYHNQNVLRERNNRETSASDNGSDSIHKSRTNSSESQTGKKIGKIKPDERYVKAFVEKAVTQAVQDKYSLEFVDKGQDNHFKENLPIRSKVEQVVKEKISDLRHCTKENSSLLDTRLLRSIIEETVIQVLDGKRTNTTQKNKQQLIVQEKGAKSQDHDYGMKILNRDMQQKLTLSKEQTMPCGPIVTHDNRKKPLDSQAIVQELLTFEEADNKNDKNKKLKKSKAAKEPTTILPTVVHIKRLKRSPRKNPEWQDPSLHDKILGKPKNAIRSQSPVSSSAAHSGRSKYSSSVLVRRSKSQGRYDKPKSDPVSLYQYYKSEWEHFRNQIPGESPHNRLRWHVRQRFLDFDQAYRF